MCACKILQRWYQTLCPWNFHWDLTRKSTAEVLNSVKWALLDISQSVRRNWSPGKQASISSSYSESLLECWKSVLTSLFSLRREADWRSCPQMHFHDFHSLSEGAAPSISCVEVFRTVIKKKNTLSQETRMKINHHWVWVYSTGRERVWSFSSSSEGCVFYLFVWWTLHLTSQGFPTPALHQLPANQTIRLVHTLFLDATSGFHRNCFKLHPLSQLELFIISPPLWNHLWFPW